MTRYGESSGKWLQIFSISPEVKSQPCPRGNPSGHIENHDGHGWICDFFQSEFFPGPGCNNSQYNIYRAPSP